MITALVKEAVVAGARLESACKELGVDARTVQRWAADPEGEDLRQGPKTKPANALTPAEEEDLLALLNSAEFVDLTPHQVVAKLADTRLVRNATDAQLLAAQTICGALAPRTAHRPWVRLQHARLRAQFGWPQLNPLLVQFSG